MDNIEGLRRQLVTYSDKLKEAESEIKQLKLIISDYEKKIYVYEGEIKTLNQFYQDFKHLVGTDVPSGNSSVDDEKPNYESLLSHYFVQKDSETASQLFNEYDKNPVDVLIDVLNLNNLENPLPSNINKIVKKHGIIKEYDIIQKSLKLIKSLNKTSFYIEKGIYYLCDLYIKNYKHNKKQALRYLKIALIIYPLQFDKFYNNIKSYLYDDIDEQIRNFKVELYGENNILLTKEEKKEKSIVSTYDDLPKPNGLDRLLEKTGKGNKNIENYNNYSISELVEMVVRQQERMQLTKALRIYSYMIRLRRPPEECLSFYNEVNKVIKYKMK